MLVLAGMEVVAWKQYCFMEMLSGGTVCDSCVRLDSEAFQCVQHLQPSCILL